MNDQLYFESLFINPEKPGYVYDPEEFVNIDNSYDFSETVIRLTSKCINIITQLRALGNKVEEFSVLCCEVDSSPENCPISTEILETLRYTWEKMQRYYSCLVCIAVSTRSSMPNNGSRSYSVRTFTKALIDQIQAYFMFQSHEAAFSPRMSGVLHRLPYADKYLIYLVYRVKHATPVYSELGNWSLCAGRKRRLSTSGESSISNGSTESSASQTYSVDPAVLTTSTPATLDLRQSDVKFSPPSGPPLPPFHVKEANIKAPLVKVEWVEHTEEKYNPTTQ